MHTYLKTLSLTSLMSIFLFSSAADARRGINAFNSPMNAFKTGAVMTFQHGNGVGVSNGFNSLEKRMPGPMDRLHAQHFDVTVAANLKAKLGPVPSEKYAKKRTASGKQRAPEMRMKGPLLRITAETGAAATAATLRRYNKKLSPTTAHEYGQYIVEASRRFGIPVSLLCGIMITESNGNKMARSTANCVGLMQINYRVHDKAILKAFGNITTEAECMIPRNNVMVGAWIFANYLKSEKGSVSGALQRYLGGPSSTYVAKVMQFRQHCVDKMAELQNA